MYEYFDDIICINLDISTERKKHSEHYFAELGIPARFFTATKHPRGGMYGCFDSHIQVLKDAYKRGLNNILIFEDDFLPTPSYTKERVHNAISFMKSNEDWDLMYFGYSFLKDDSNGLQTIFDAKYCTPDIVKYNPYLTQAVCYSKKAIKTVVENYEECFGILHYDEYLGSYLKLNSYCVVPMLFDQNFQLQHNNEGRDIFEKLIRFIYPVIAYTKLNYRVTLLMYLANRYQRYTSYFHIFIFSLFLYKIKLSLLASKKIYIKDSR
jgi:GR25 family glycosyltransferase involved in LPS biosynthesis